LINAFFRVHGDVQRAADGCAHRRMRTRQQQRFAHPYLKIHALAEKHLRLHFALTGVLAPGRRLLG